MPIEGKNWPPTAVYSDDAEAAVVIIAAAIKPVLLHVLAANFNPAMLAQVIVFLEEAFCMYEGAAV